MDEAVVTTEPHATCEAAKLKALQVAARAGFACIDEGRYRDLQEHEMADFIANLGRLAAGRVRSPRR